jgi:HAD superfamily hydrolase (TIGR01509 family)
MALVRHVIFDLGNVVVRWNPRNLYRKLFPDTVEGRSDMERFLATVVPLDAFNRRVDLGEDLTALCEETILAHPEFDPELIRAYENRHEEMWDGTIDDTVALLRQLRSQGVPCYALSNWGRNFALAEQVYPVLTEFDGRVISHEVGVIKPDHSIFQIVLDRFNLRADECLFIDDSAQNIIAAQEVGFQTHRFTDPIRLRAHLDELGLIRAEPSARWESSGQHLNRNLLFADFAEAWAYMSSMASAAEALGHHPEWSNIWNKVNVSLTTHDAGRTVTHLDRTLAAESDRTIRTVIGPRAHTLAVQFVDHLLGDDVETAHRMLSLRSAANITQDELGAAWAAMGNPADPFVSRSSDSHLEDWPDRADDDIRWCYVGVWGRSTVEAVTVTVSMVDGQPQRLVIDSVEFGRP